ncbi:MAG TPA: VIT1/CCC1 transporter family protein [Steroidobacteraceae bacterium]|nr:VIT1/CCC1 transporter family protein [Steroidobacteraceae bacterium]
MTASGVDSWYHEKESAWLYRRVAAAEADPGKSELFLKLAAAAEEQAAKWQLAARRADPGAHAGVRAFVPSLRARIVARLLSRFDPRSLRAVLAAMKLRGLSVYSAPASVAGHPMPTTLAEVGARHRSALGGSLRAGVFGVNDGLVSNASLVLGVAGAGAASGYVLTTGVAGLLAGALSMAAGEYVSVRSQREMYEYQIALEREELAEYPQEEAEELALIYQARGMDLTRAREVSQALLAHPEQALDVLAREELGLNPDDLGSPWRAAGASFVAFAAGAALPLIPFLAGLAGVRAIATVAGVTLTALFAVGLGLSLFTGRNALRGALRMVLIGGGAGAVSFLVGRTLGVVIG